MRGFLSIVAVALLAVCMFAADVDAHGRGFGRRGGGFSNRGGDVRAFSFSFGNGGRGIRNFSGSRTFVDEFGNVWQVDRFGNAVIVGSAARGFGVRRGFSFGFGY